MIGARNSSVNGRKIAAQLATGLVKADLVVISGMARGVDGAAHGAALRAAGKTIAVLAGGTDVEQRTRAARVKLETTFGVPAWLDQYEALYRSVQHSHPVRT